MHFPTEMLKNHEHLISKEKKCKYVVMKKFIVSEYFARFFPENL